MLSVILGDALLGTWSAVCSGFAILWYVLETTDGGAWLGIVSAAGLVPAIVGAFLSGPAVGWMGSRRLLLLSRGVGNLGLAVLAILLATDALSMPVLAILTFVASAAAGPAAAADSARFPELTRLARIRLGRFNAVNNAAMSLASLSGLLASAWLVAHWGVAATLYLALAAGTLALLALAIGFPHDNRVYRRRLRRTGAPALIREASQFLLQSPSLAPVLLTTTSVAAVFTAVSDVLVPLIVERSALHAKALAWIFIAAELSAVLGALAYARIEHRMQTLPALRVCLIVFTLSMLVLACAPVFAMALVLAVVIGFTFGILDPFTETQIQRHSPAHVRRGTIGIAAGVEMSLAPFVVLLVGAGETALGMVPVLLMQGAVLAAVAWSLTAVARRGLPLSGAWVASGQPR